VELTRRYSNRADHANALVRTLKLVRAQHTHDTRASVAATPGGSSPSPTVRAKIDSSTVAASYSAGSTLVELARSYGVSASTIKRVLRERGTRSTDARLRRTPNIVRRCPDMSTRLVSSVLDQPVDLLEQLLGQVEGVLVDQVEVVAEVEQVLDVGVGPSDRRVARTV
jgi:hypothetical protein